MRRIRKHPQRRHGVTLVELLIALSIAALVSAATVAMLSAVAYGSETQSGKRQALVVSRTLAARIGTAIRTAVEVSYVHSTGRFIVLWVDDTNDDGQRQRGEMVLIERNSAAKELRFYSDPTDTNDGSDASLFRANAVFTYDYDCWATGVTAIDFEIVSPSGAEQALVNYRVTVLRDDISETSVGSVAIRNATPSE